MTKGLKYPCKIDLAMFDLIFEAILKQDSVRRQTSQPQWISHKMYRYSSIE